MAVSIFMYTRYTLNRLDIQHTYVDGKPFTKTVKDM